MGNFFLKIKNQLSLNHKKVSLHELAIDAERIGHLTLSTAQDICRDLDASTDYDYPFDGRDVVLTAYALSVMVIIRDYRLASANKVMKISTLAAMMTEAYIRNISGSYREKLDNINIIKEETREHFDRYSCLAVKILKNFQDKEDFPVHDLCLPFISYAPYGTSTDEFVKFFSIILGGHYAKVSELILGKKVHIRAYSKNPLTAEFLHLISLVSNKKEVNSINNRFSSQWGTHTERI